MMDVLFTIGAGAVILLTVFGVLAVFMVTAFAAVDLSYWIYEGVKKKLF